MEDVVTEAEGSVLPLSLSPRISDKEEAHEAEDDKKDPKAEVGGDGKVGGSISRLFPRLIHEREAEVEKKEGRGVRGIVNECAAEEKDGGFITHIISNSVSPLSPKVGEVTELQPEFSKVDSRDSKSEEDVGVGGHGVGIINNLVSIIFHRSNGGEQSDEHKEAERLNIVEGREKPEAEEEGEGGGGGLIDNIASHLPTSLPGEVFYHLIAVFFRQNFKH